MAARFVTEISEQSVKKGKEVRVANSRSVESRDAAETPRKRIEGLRKSAKVLAERLRRETRARQLEARLRQEAQLAQVRLSKELKALRNLLRAQKADLDDAVRRHESLDRARRDALRALSKVKAELSNKIAMLREELSARRRDLRLKSQELKKLVKESSHRAAEIIRTQPSDSRPVERTPDLPAARPHSELPAATDAASTEQDIRTP